MSSPWKKRSSENDDFAQYPQHHSGLERKERVKQSPVERKSEERDTATVVLQVQHCIE